MSDKATEEKPLYTKVFQTDSGATPKYMIICDEGWRESIVCCEMYEWVADWLIEVLQGKPYAKERII